MRRGEIGLGEEIDRPVDVRWLFRAPDTGRDRWIEGKPFRCDWLAAFNARAIVTVFDPPERGFDPHQFSCTLTFACQCHGLGLDRVDAGDATDACLVEFHRCPSAGADLGMFHELSPTGHQTVFDGRNVRFRVGHPRSIARAGRHLKRAGWRQGAVEFCGVPAPCGRGLRSWRVRCWRQTDGRRWSSCSLPHGGGQLSGSAQAR